MKTYKKNKQKRISYLRSDLYYILILLAIGLVSSCKKFIDIGPPSTQLATNNVFSDPSTATAAQTAIYSQMSLSAMARLSGLSSDEFVNYNLSPDLPYLNTYKNELVNLNGQFLGGTLWTPAYKYIYQANAVIEGLENSSAIDTSVKSQLIGEAKFIRAWWHFYLTNFYGDIPIVTTTDYTKNLELERAKPDAVYDQIIRDLKEAEGLLSTNYVDATSGKPGTDRFRPNRWAATALLARIYLYRKQYKEAEEKANNIISNTSVYQLLPNFDQIFLTASKEAIWQISPEYLNKTGQGNTIEGLDFILNASPENTNSVSLSNDLLNAFEPGDKRRTNWVGSFPAGGKTYYFPFKYKIKTTVSKQESSMMLRLAEQYLIRAEARIWQGNIEEGVKDLNILRDRARETATTTLPNPLPDLATTLSQEDALKAVAHERQVELFAECHRWFDLKRSNTIDASMGNPGNASQRKGGSWKAYQQNYPIAETEVIRSGRVKQTTGY